MFQKKLARMMGKTWKPYVITIFSAIFVNVSFLISVNHPEKVFFGILILWFLAVIVSMAVFYKKNKSINKDRAVAGLQKSRLMQADLDPSRVSLDMAFLIFASWKAGEAIIKIPTVLGTITQGQLIFIFSTLVLTMAAVLYSFIKVLDKIKEYKGINPNNPTANTSILGLRNSEMFWNSFWDFLIAFLILIISPALMGLLYAWNFG